jgi:hypothetical protein
MISVKVGRINLSPTITKGRTLAQRIKTQVTLAAREDTKPYVPYLSNALRASAELASVPEAGLLIYDTVYARAQYYGLPGKTTPGTCMQWFEASKAANRYKWLEIAKLEASLV